MSALIGALRVSLSAETAQFEAGMKRAQRSTTVAAGAIQKSMGLIKSSIAGLAAGLSVGLFVNVIKDALEYTGALAHVAQQLGVTARDLQVFSFAATQLGVSQETLEAGLKRLTITMGRLAAGAEAPRKALDAVHKGLADQIMTAKDGGDAFRKLADALQPVTSRAQRAAIEVAALGKSGADLDNLLSGGSAALNELADAADKLGIVLSDEQIQNASDTASKLKALKTVLEANIASAVTQNTGAILGLANALATLIRSIGDAINGWRILMHEFKAVGSLAALNPQGYTNEMNAAKAIQNGGIAFGTGSVTMKLPRARPKSGAAGGTDIGKFLAPGGGGGGSRHSKGAADHSAEDALRNAFQFDQELRRSQMDVLHATQDLAKDYIERTSIGIEILNAEKDAFTAEQQYQVALYKLSKGKDGLSQAQSDQLKLEYDKTDAMKRELLIQEEREQRLADTNMLELHDFDRRKDVLQSQEGIARTAAERRKIELELLDIAYQQRKQALEYTIQTSKDIGAVEDARRDLLNLNATYANDKQGVMDNTRGPLEDYFSTIPKTAAEATEAMQRFEVEGIDGAINSIIALTDGFDSFRDTALNAIRQVLAEMLKMQLMKWAFSLFGAAAGKPMSGGLDMGMVGSLPHFARGGSMIIGGNGGTDRNLVSINGLPTAYVNRGEAMHFVPNGGGMGGGPVININVSGNPTRETLNQIAARTRSAIAGANRAGV